MSERHPEENELIRLYNGMSLLSGLGTLFMTNLAWWIDFPFPYVVVTLCVAQLYTAVIILNALDKIKLARYFISVGSPLWISTTYFLLGGYFGQSLAIMASMAITYVAFRETPRTRLALLVFHLVIFFAASIYVHHYGPLLGLIDFPYDDLIVFIGGLGWATILLFKFDKDRSQLLRDLRDNNRELQDTTEELERFTYIASHDLKSPLRTIISFIGLIEKDLERGRYTQILSNLSFVKTGAEQMHFLVQDILELSKLKSHKIQDRSRIDLNLVMEKALQNLQDEIQEKAVRLDCAPLPHFVGNELEFLLLFQNFIQNGIKYNESQPPVISITTHRSAEQLYLVFTDNGIGIEARYHEQIFQFFKRLHNSAQYSGTGLGLGLCKKIVDNYGGQILLDSRLGTGATFTVVLPIQLEDPDLLPQSQPSVAQHC